MTNTPLIKRIELNLPQVPTPAVPAWSRNTYRAIVRAICAGNVIEGAGIQNLQSSISEALRVRSVLLCGSGSFALELALRACGVQQNDEVVIPTFCCSAVAVPILALGATPVLADVGEELNVTTDTIAAVLTKKTRAVVVPHLFGNPAEVRAITKLAHSRDIHVIEDAAQALGASIDNQPVGTFADYGILSFGDEKICSGIGGGALVCRDKDVFLERSKAQLTSPARIETLGKCFSTLMWKSWGHWSAPPWRICLSHADPAALPSPYRRESMANLCAAVAVTLMENLDQQISARRECVRAYQKLLGKESRLKLIRHRSGSACLTQVVRILPKDRDVAVEVVKAVRAEGYEVRGCYVPLHLISELSSCLWDRLPYADRVWSDLVELPCDPAVGVDEVQRIAAIVAGVASN